MIEYGAPVGGLSLGGRVRPRALAQAKSATPVGDTILVGYATRYGKPHIHGSDVEVMSRGCFAVSLKSARSIGFLRNHSWSHNFGSTADGSLDLFEDDLGLAFSFRPRDDEDGRRLVADVKAGRLQCSIGYYCDHSAMRHVGEDECKFVHEALLREISVVERPAVRETTITAVPAATFPGLRESCRSGGMEKYVAAANWERAQRRLRDALDKLGG